MSKSENSAYFHHIFANKFFWCIFSKLFQRIRNQREILRWYTLIAKAHKTAQKTENLFYECVLEFNWATIKGFA